MPDRRANDRHDPVPVPDESGPLTPEAVGPPGRAGRRRAGRFTGGPVAGTVLQELIRDVRRRRRNIYVRSITRGPSRWDLHSRAGRQT